MQNFIDCVLEK
jgi:hypothetical protein